MTKITTKAIKSIQQLLSSIKNKIKNLKKNQKEQILDIGSFDLYNLIKEEKIEDVNLGDSSNDNLEEIIKNIDESYGKLNDLLQPSSPKNKTKATKKPDDESILDSIVNDDLNVFIENFEKEYNKTKLRKIFDNIIKILTPLKKIKSLIPYINKVEKTVKEINDKNMHTKKVTDQREKQKNNPGGGPNL
ncbi:MAG TPA: hypothetical protein QKA08_04730 [Candidatus Megaira endosymbiont of Nemacystus decipiens]|nr:hypothetical protein [Candidatus Megaera endosymbiont of Nemacystus decipiens]